LLGQAQTSSTEIIPRGAVWKYLDDGSNQGTAWQTAGFNDASWASGPAELGYGDGDEATVVSYGPSSSNKYPTTYFRHTFTLTDTSDIQYLNVWAMYDDGAVIYINGVEVGRPNMPSGTIAYNSYSTGSSEEGEFSTAIPNSMLNIGTNVMAVEIHQTNASSSDISFNASLVAVAYNAIPVGAIWKYLDDGSDQGTAWRAPSFNDSGWASGPAELGYGDGDEATEVDDGAVLGIGVNPTTYFRTSFQGKDIANVSTLQIRLLRDDGAIVYLNGTEVVRSNMPSGTINYDDYADETVSGSAEEVFQSYTLPASHLVTGTNVIAVEIHQRGSTSSDISFNLELVPDPPVSVDRGAYLQNGTQTSMTVRWRTNVGTSSKVWYGTSPTNLTQTIYDSTLVTEHEMTITGLTLDSKYYYAIGTGSDTLGGFDNAHFFHTLPPVGSTDSVRIWVIGDAGTADNNARDVRDAYYAHTGSTYTDVWLMLGDNAYDSGTDTEYQVAVFENMYETMLQQTVTWPCPGNHDYGSADADTESGPYYDIFTVPTAGEAGGLASGTEAYYSFDYGNIHFISLDSHDTDRSTGSPMLQWLQADLAATLQEWIIVYFHHPPYTKGSHDSDLEPQLWDVRSNFLPILENAGVDLVLTGHSHSYERSMLINGHYGFSFDFDNSMIVDGGSGKHDLCEAYVKSTTGANAGQGAVYAVAGSSGKKSGGLSQHPVMYSFYNELGSVLIDVHDKRLDFTFIREDGTTPDHFTIFHDYTGGAIDMTINHGDSVTLTASWMNGSYLWPTGETTQSIVVSPSSTTSYLVEDPIGCQTDTFNVTVTLTNTQALTYTPDPSDFPNPERGMYRQYSSHSSPTVPALNPLDQSDLDGDRLLNNMSLCLRVYYLTAFKEGPLSDDYLEFIENDLATLRASGNKAILRFAYNNSTQTHGHTDDASLAYVLQHISDLEPIFRANSDVIAVVQTGFVGTWGEWHYTHPDFVTTGSTPDYAARQMVTDALLAAIPRERMIQIRTPEHKHELYGGGGAFNQSDALPAGQAHSGSIQARVGHHNDCFLASDTDYGTYSSNATTRADEKAYLEAETQFLPMGGETCNLNPPRSDCESVGGDADVELDRFHWSYLHENYNRDVLDRWDASLGGSGDCYDDIRLGLGYRFELMNAFYPIELNPGCEMAIEMNLKNVGYAAPYNPREVELVLRNTATPFNEYRVNLVNQDPRFWFKESELPIIQIQETVGLPSNIPTGTYDLFLHLPDPDARLHDNPHYAIRLANVGMWEATTGYNDLNHQLTIIGGSCSPAYTGTQWFSNQDVAVVEWVVPVQPNCDDLSFAPTVLIQNLGDDNLTTAIVECWVNDSLVATVNWTGNLITGSNASVSFPIYAFDDDDVVRVEVHSPNGQEDSDHGNNMILQTLEEYSNRDVFEPNDALGQAAELPTIGVNWNARICEETDQDWFKFVIGTDNNVLVYLSDLSANFDLELYTASGLMVASSNQLGNLNETLAFNNATVGATYYLRVFGVSGAISTEGYRLSLLTRALPFAGNAIRDASKDLTGNQPQPELFVFPVPTDGILNGNFPADRAEEGLLTIRDVQGRLCMSRVIEVKEGLNEISLDLKGLSSGVYSISLQLKEYLMVSRFEVQR